MIQNSEYAKIHDDFFVNGYNDGVLFFFLKDSIKRIVQSGQNPKVGTLLQSANQPISVVICENLIVHEQLLFDTEVMGFVLDNYHSEVDSLDDYPKAFGSFFNHLIACRYLGDTDDVLYEVSNLLGLVPELIKIKKSFFVVQDNGQLRQVI